jgi:hypothetical protein
METWKLQNTSFQALTFDIVIRPAVTYRSRTISPFPPSPPPHPLSILLAYRSNKGIQFDPAPLVYRTTAKPPQSGRIMDSYPVCVM